MNYSPEVMKNMGEWVSKQTFILEKEMIEAKAQEMQQEIDFEILWGMLQGIGWTRVMLPRLVDNKHAVDITHWLALNTKKAFERRGRDFIFEDAKDANWFVLRWGTV
jgi:hypothetical protein